MKYYNKKIIPLLIGLLVVLGLGFNISNGKGLQQENTISIEADKDTYVSSADPLSNFGNLTLVRVGYLGDSIYIAYFHFDLSDKPKNFFKAEISLHPSKFYIGETVTFSIGSIEENWDELSMTWMNKPNSSEKITSFLATGAVWLPTYEIDITDYVTGKTNISVCVYIDNYVDDWYLFCTREHTIYPSDRPLLILTYMETEEILVTNPSTSSSWEVGTAHFIEWTSTNDISEVNIEIYKGNALKYQFNEESNNGSFYWLIPNNCETGTGWRVKIYDTVDPNIYDWSEYFVITSRSNEQIVIPSYSMLMIVLILSFSITFSIQRFLRLKSKRNS